MTEQEYYNEILGPDSIEPPEVGVVVEHTGKVDKVKEGNPRARQEGYPWDEEIDYDPNFDEDLERED